MARPSPLAARSAVWLRYMEGAHTGSICLPRERCRTPDRQPAGSRPAAFKLVRGAHALQLILATLGKQGMAHELQDRAARSSIPIGRLHPAAVIAFHEEGQRSGVARVGTRSIARSTARRSERRPRGARRATGVVADAAPSYRRKRPALDRDGENRPRRDAKRIDTVAEALGSERRVQQY